MFSIEFSRKAEKAIEGLPKETSKRIISAIESLQQEPFPRGAIRLKWESNMYRVRVGDYRVLYEVYTDKKIVLIANVDKRSRVYDF